MSEDQAVDELHREFIEDYLPQKRKARMEAFRRKPVEHQEGPEVLPDACARGECEHPEHAADDELEDL